MEQKTMTYYAEKMTTCFLTRAFDNETMGPPTKEELKNYEENFREKRKIQEKLVEFIFETYMQPFTVEILHGMHRIVKDESNDIGVGKFKEHPNYVGKYSDGISQEKASPEETPQMVDELIDRLNVMLSSNWSEEKNIREIAKGHIEFEQIHPYEDGNGTVGRALILYLSVKRGMTPFVLERQQYHLCNKLIEERDDQTLATLLISNYLAEKEKSNV